jgi:hypothetical protein
MTGARRPLVMIVPLIIGVGLLAATVFHIDVPSLTLFARQIGGVLPLLFLPGAAWHLLRTIAWRECFPSDARPSFGRVFRVRLAAEAFSWVTIRGVAGEPLKVALLDPEIRQAAAAAVALERIAYIVTTAGILALSAGTALAVLPLTNAWRRVFIGVGISGAALIAGTLWLLLRRAPSQSPQPAPRAARTAATRFLIAVGEQVRCAARENPRRLMHLLALESAAYFAMAVEVWTVFHFVAMPVTLNAAFAVETLTRIASMASAFIPANLGALEASNVAAASAVHAAGGAAALALARRVRGLFWCAGGFLIYPRSRRPTVAATDAIVILEDCDSGVPVSKLLGGMPMGERLLRVAARAGCSPVLVWAPQQKQIWDSIVRHADLPLEVIVAAEESHWHLALEKLAPEMRPIVVAPGVVPSPQLIASIRAGHRGIDVVRTDRRELGSPATLAMHLKASTVANVNEPRQVVHGGAVDSVRVDTANDLRMAERLLRGSIIKPTDGPLGRFNRRISIPISIGLIRTMRLSAHVMTALVFAASLYAGWLFSKGNYVDGVIAAVVSLAASVLDGCDGELARLQYTDSAFGCWLDTGDWRHTANGVARLLVDFRIAADRSDLHVEPPHPAARANHRRTSRAAPNNREREFRERRQDMDTVGSAAFHVRDARDDAVRPPGLRGTQSASRVCRPFRSGSTRVLDQPGPAAQELAEDARRHAATTRARVLTTNRCEKSWQPS